MNSNSFAAALMVSIAFALGPGVGHAQAFDNAQELDALRAEMTSTAAEVRGNIGAALEGMKQIGQIDASEQAIAVNEYFDAIESEARAVLSEVSRNSEFADELLLMRSNIVALIATLEAEEVTAERERNLARLTAAQDRYNALYDQIAEAEKQIIGAIVANNTARTSVLRNIQIGAVESAVNQLQDVAETLVALVDVMDSISAVAIDSPSGVIAQQ